METYIERNLTCYIFYGAILTLKNELAQIEKHFLKDMNNKSFKNQGKTAGSRYPPKSSCNVNVLDLFYMTGVLYDCLSYL